METQLVKICGIAILCVAVIMVMREIKSGFPWAAKLGGIVLVCGIILLNIGEIKSNFVLFEGNVYISEYIAVMLKAFGIAFLVRVCSDVCRECGEGSIAFSVESAGKLCILYMCIPIIKDIFGYLVDILELGEI